MERGLIMAMQAKINRVLLLNPPSKVFISPDARPAHRKHCTPPIGIAYLAASALKHGYEPILVDSVVEGYDNEWFIEPFLYYGLDTKAIVARVAAAKPDLI